MVLTDVFGDVIEEPDEPIVEEPTKKVSVFDITNDISFDKNYIYDESVFNQFLAIKAFSQHLDTIMYANALNKGFCRSNKMAHDFLFYSIRKKKRYGKWAKVNDSDKLIGLLKKKYCLSNEVAQYYLDMMSDDEKKDLEQEFVVGGSRK